MAHRFIAGETPKKALGEFERLWGAGVASSVDLVVHLGIDAGGVRRVNEIVAVPGRVENDIVETEPVFLRQGGDLVHTGGMPSRLDTFERAGVDVHRLLRGAD